MSNRRKGGNLSILTSKDYFLSVAGKIDGLTCIDRPFLPRSEYMKEVDKVISQRPPDTENLPLIMVERCKQLKVIEKRKYELPLARGEDKSSGMNLVDEYLAMAEMQSKIKKLKNKSIKRSNSTEQTATRRVMEAREKLISVSKIEKEEVYHEGDSLIDKSSGNFPKVKLDPRKKAKLIQKQKEESFKEKMSQKLKAMNKNLIKKKFISKLKGSLERTSLRPKNTFPRLESSLLEEEKKISGPSENITNLNIESEVCLTSKVILLKKKPGYFTMRESIKDKDKSAQLLRHEPCVPVPESKSKGKTTRTRSVEKLNKSPGAFKPSTQLKDLIGYDQYKNKVKNDHQLVGLLHACWFINRSTSQTPTNQVCRFHLGVGNNQKIVYTILKSRENFQQETFIGRSSVCWTQIAHKKTVDEKWPVNTVLVNELVKDKSKNSTKILQSLYDDIFNLISGCRRFRVSKESLVPLALEYLKDINTATLTVIDPIQGVPEKSTPPFPFMPNHVRGVRPLTKKHLLFSTISRYCIKNEIDWHHILPNTYLISSSTKESDLYHLLAQRNKSLRGFEIPLIVKPGENSNRGHGIAMAYSESDLRAAVDNLLSGRKKLDVLVVQEYISNPLLYKGRKFDLRCYGLIVKLGKRFAFYWYSQGYARTSSYTYDQNQRDNLKIHLTNEAIQVQGNIVLYRCQNLRKTRTW